MRTCWTLILSALCITITCLADDLPLINEFVIDLAVNDEPRSVIESMGFKFIRKLQGHEFSYLAELPDESFKNVSNHISRMKRNAVVIGIEQQRQLIRTKRDALYWNDLQYPDMWYLIRASKNDHTEVDLNVQEAWQLGYSGKGVVVTIMDDGLDHTHPDLFSNYAEQASWDVNNGDQDPMPNVTNPDNKHGTRCAGQVAAVGNNSVCIVGVAFNARIGGIRMLDGTITDRVEAESLSFNQNYIDIYSGSWGPDDTGLIYEGPGRRASEAFHMGATTGRNGLGNIFVWASGNGGRRGDSCAADGYVSSIYTLAVSSVTEQNSHPWYLEKCAATMVSTYSSGGPGESGIVTTDLNHSCTTLHTGTSASAPLAVGIVALLLEANPKLTWRDVQYVLLLTANPRPFKDGDFTKNGADYLYSNYYGFGLMDAGKAVRLGEIWRTLPPHHRCTTSVKQLSRDLSTIFSEKYAFKFTGCRPYLSMGSKDGRIFHQRIQEEGEPVAYVEHIQVFLTVHYRHRGLVRVRVISPSGTVSELMPVRLPDAFSEFKGLDRWPLMSVQFWGEPSAGEWKIIIDNMEGYKKLSARVKNFPNSNQPVGQWESVYMVAYGTEMFPIRLRPPKADRMPPKAWFDRFSRYVVTDEETAPQPYKCHDQCVTNDCWGPMPNQCLNGCKNYITESRQCVTRCPGGTTAVMSSISSKPMNQSTDPQPLSVRSGVTVNELRCGRCFPACAECLRPYAAHGCTACSGDSYLAPFLARNPSVREPNPEALRRLTMHMHPGRILVGSCVSRCPSGYFANETSRICEQCAEHCEECLGAGSDACQKCARNFRLVEGACAYAAGPYRCPKSSFLQGNICVPCTTGCDTCSEYGLCTFCDSNHRFMQEGRCENTCRPGFFPAFQLTRMGLFELQVGDSSAATSGVWACAPCPPGCVLCSPSGNRSHGYAVPKCDVCQEGFLQESAGGVCKSPCPPGTFGGNCSRSCHHLCLACVNDSDSCLHCSRGTSLVYGEREGNQLTPLIRPQIIGYSCVVLCPEATYMARVGNEAVCLQCPPLCKSCAAPDKCTACEEGYRLNKNNSMCEILPVCSHEAYLDNLDRLCKPCHSSCESCRGPTPEDCLDCHRVGSNKIPSPACFEPPHQMKTVHPTDQQQPTHMETTASSITTGTCHACCGADRLLDTSPPTDCFFCLPNEQTCSSWSAVVGGLALHVNYTFSSGSSWTTEAPFPLPDTPSNGWTWLTSDPTRLGFFIVAVSTIAIAIGFLIYHLIVIHVRKRHLRNYNFLFLRNCGAISRVTQRFSEDGNSPVIHTQTIPNGSKRERLLATNSGNNPRSTGAHNHNLLTSAPAQQHQHQGNHSLSLTSLPLYQTRQSSKRNRKPFLSPISTLFLSKSCKYASPSTATRSPPKRRDYLKIGTNFD